MAAAGVQWLHARPAGVDVAAALTQALTRNGSLPSRARRAVEFIALLMCCRTRYDAHRPPAVLPVSCELIVAGVPASALALPRHKTKLPVADLRAIDDTVRPEMSEAWCNSVVAHQVATGREYWGPVLLEDVRF
jgi:hypothetical protein